MTVDRSAVGRDALLVLLTLTTGAVDATAFLAAGKVFSSVITGNLVLLGIGAGERAGTAAISAGVALTGYCAGVLAGALIAAGRGRRRRQDRGGDRGQDRGGDRGQDRGGDRGQDRGGDRGQDRGGDRGQDRGGDRGEDRRVWPPAVTTSLGLEFALLAAFCCGWEMNGRRATWHLPALAVLACAMGVQSAAARRLGQVSTTYLTGALTSLLAGLVARETPERAGQYVAVLTAMAAGAAAATVALRLAPYLLPAAMLGPLALVIAAAGAGHLAAGRRSGAAVPAPMRDEIGG